MLAFAFIVMDFNGTGFAFNEDRKNKEVMVID